MIENWISSRRRRLRARIWNTLKLNFESRPKYRVSRVFDLANKTTWFFVLSAVSFVGSLSSNCAKCDIFQQRSLQRSKYFFSQIRVYTNHWKNVEKISFSTGDRAVVASKYDKQIADKSPGIES